MGNVHPNSQISPSVKSYAEHKTGKEWATMSEVLTLIQKDLRGAEKLKTGDPALAVLACSAATAHSLNDVELIERISKHYNYPEEEEESPPEKKMRTTCELELELPASEPALPASELELEVPVSEPALPASELELEVPVSEPALPASSLAAPPKKPSRSIDDDDESFHSPERFQEKTKERESTLGRRGWLSKRSPELEAEKAILAPKKKGDANNPSQDEVLARTLSEILGNHQKPRLARKAKDECNQKLKEAMRKKPRQPRDPNAQVNRKGMFVPAPAASNEQRRDIANRLCRKVLVKPMPKKLSSVQRYLCGRITHFLTGGECNTAGIHFEFLAGPFRSEETIAPPTDVAVPPPGESMDVAIPPPEELVDVSMPLDEGFESSEEEGMFLNFSR